MKVFYHTDLDGHCSGAIVYRFFKGKGEYISIDYKDDFPFDRIEPNEKIIIVDFSLQKEGGFNKLLEITKDITWIDHHITAIEKHKEIADKISGLRCDGTAACELCWEYFFTNEVVHYAVVLAGDYDVWKFDYGEATNQFQTGARLYSTIPESPVWNDWLDINFDLNPLLKEGEIALRYRTNYWNGLAKKWSFPIEFEGYKCIACNAGSVSSQLFDSVSEGYDIMIPFIFDGNQWTVSLYSVTGVDVSEIAKKYGGGGGHKKASGFQCKELPFKKI